MATDTTLAAITEQQNILRQKAAAARTAANNAATDEERAKFQAERDSYNAQIKTLTAQAETATKQDPATSTYAGTDANSGKDKYYNPVTGTMSLSDTPPTDAQKATFANTVNQSGAPADPATSADATPPAVAKASLPVDINQTAALTEGQVSNVGNQPVKEQVGPPEQTVVTGQPVTNVVVQPQLSPLTQGDVNPYPPVTTVIIPESGGSPIGDGSAVVTTQADRAVSAMNQESNNWQATPTPIEPGGTATGDGAAVVTPQVAQAQSAMNQASNAFVVSPPTIEETNANILAAIKKPEAATGPVPYPSGNWSYGQGQYVAPIPLPPPKIDWRVKLTLSNNADWSSVWFGNPKAPTILSPLAAEKGVTFPYTPTIQMGYKANYDSPDIQHTNFKVHFYRNSYADDVSITAEFTAQDTLEANYLLATMHFFRTVTKMFYGNDVTPIAGTPPPLLFLSGYGKNQFDRKPLVLTSFSYTLPNDVDYIRTNTAETWSGISIEKIEAPSSNKISPPKSPIRDWLSKTLRLENNKLPVGAQTPPPPNFLGKNLNNDDSTYVPTKIQFSLTLKPVVNRFEMSNNYGTNEYAQNGGFW